MNNPKKKKIVSGSILAPVQTMPEQEQRFPYWVGALPECPMDPVHVAGITFSKITEEVLPPDVGTKQNKRVPHVGQIVMLTRAKLDLLLEKLPLKVFRFRDNAPDESRGGSGQVLDGTPVKPRVGFLLTKPTQAEHEAAAQQGKPHWVQPHVPRTTDEPAGDYLYCVPAVNGQRAPGEVVPPSLGITGLEWPQADTTGDDA